MTNVSLSNIQKTLLTCALAAGVFASASNAVAQERIVQVNVPFAFETGLKHFPAGEYRIELTSRSLMLLRGTAANSAGFAMTIPEERSKAPTQGKVVFRGYGDHYYLGEVWLAGESTGRKCAMSHAEKKAVVAMNATTPTNVELALNASHQ